MRHYAPAHTRPAKQGADRKNENLKEKRKNTKKNKNESSKRRRDFKDFGRKCGAALPGTHQKRDKTEQKRRKDETGSAIKTH